MIVDITQQFISYISTSSQVPFEACAPRIAIEAQICYKQSSDILHSISKIGNILISNKEKYFSNQAYSYDAFNDQQRNQFDRQMKILLDGVNIKIGQFKEVVDEVRFSSTTEKQHLKNMAVCLYQKYKQISNSFKQFVQFNQNRKKKLQAIIGNDVKNQYKKALHNQPNLSQVKRKISQIDPQLEEQSKTIFIQRMSQQKKIQETRQTIEQINGMLEVMENKVLEQQLLTSSFRQIGEIGLFHIQKGNKNLVDANTLSKDSGRMWTLFFLTLALSLLILDYIKS